MHEDVRSMHNTRIIHRSHEHLFSVVNLLVLPQLSDSCIPRLADFLTHQYPTASVLTMFLDIRAHMSITSDSSRNSTVPLSLPSEQGYWEGHR